MVILPGEARARSGSQRPGFIVVDVLDPARSQTSHVVDSARNGKAQTLPRESARGATVVFREAARLDRAAIESLLPRPPSRGVGGSAREKVPGLTVFRHALGGERSLRIPNIAAEHKSRGPFCSAGVRRARS